MYPLGGGSVKVGVKDQQETKPCLSLCRGEWPIAQRDLSSRVGGGEELADFGGIVGGEGGAAELGLAEGIGKAAADSFGFEGGIEDAKAGLMIAGLYADQSCALI